MNAAIRAVVRRGIGLGVEVVGIRDGYSGLHRDEIVPLTAADVGNVIQQGGTMLGTARCREFLQAEGRARCAQNMHRNGVEGLVVIGGDGSFRGAQAIAREHGVAVIGLPGTIDNDIAGTDYTIGFDTAINTALDAIDRLRDTAQAHRRLFFVEVMGRSVGWIAAYVGLAGGADEILVPEIPTNLKALCDKIRGEMEKNKRSAIVVVAEGDDAGGAFDIAKVVKDELAVEARVCILGHVQRGGRPTARDRVLASRLGAAAVEALLEGRSGVALGQQSGRIVATPFGAVLARQKRLEVDLVELARRLSG
jgi:6-phosphofructokinase 1